MHLFGAIIFREAYIQSDICVTELGAYIQGGLYSRGPIFGILQYALKNNSDMKQQISCIVSCIQRFEVPINLHINPVTC